MQETLLVKSPGEHVSQVNRVSLPHGKRVLAAVDR